MNIKKIMLLSLLTVNLITSCSPISNESSTSSEVNKLNFKVLSPLGAPSISYACFIKDSKENVSIVQANTISSNIISSNYDAFIFDLANGINLIKNNNLDYKLVTPLTIGNCYVVATGNDIDKTISSDDNIVSFGKSATFTKIFEKVHDVKVKSEVNDVSSTPSIIKTGLYNGEKVDYVLVAEPVLTSLFSSKTSQESYYLEENLTTSWLIYSKDKGLNSGKGYSGFIQAGLFISSKLEKEEYKDDVNYFLDNIKLTVADIKTNDANLVLNDINYLVENQIISDDYFGVSSSILNKVLNKFTNPNKVINPFGFNYNGFDVNKFILEANIEGLNQIPSNLFSKFYSAS